MAIFDVDFRKNRHAFCSCSSPAVGRVGRVGRRVQITHIRSECPCTELEMDRSRRGEIAAPGAGIKNARSRPDISPPSVWGEGPQTTVIARLREPSRVDVGKNGEHQTRPADYPRIRHQDKHPRRVEHNACCVVYKSTRVNALLVALSLAFPLSTFYEENVEDELDGPSERCAPRSRACDPRSQPPTGPADADLLHGRRIPQQPTGVQLASGSRSSTDPAMVSQSDLLRRSGQCYTPFMTSRNCNSPP